MSKNFIPSQVPSSTGTIVVAASSGSASIPAECPDIRLRWVGTASADGNVKWGKGAQTATTSNMVLSSGIIEMFGKQDADTIAVVGTGTLYYTCGTGQ